MLLAHLFFLYFFRSNTRIHKSSTYIYRVVETQSVRRDCTTALLRHSEPETMMPKTVPAVVVHLEDGVPLPVEPLWTLESAALLLLMSVPSLKAWLRKHRDDPQINPPMYMGSPGRRRRVLTSSEIRYIRSVIVGPFRPPSWRSLGANERRSP